MPTYQGQVSEEGVIALVEYIKNLDSDYRVQQTLNTTDLVPESAGGKAAPAGQGARGAEGGQAMSAATIVSLPDQSTARIPKMNFLTKENGLLSWLLTGDHKRIATLYLISITFFFFIGGALAGLIRLELLTPQTSLMAADTYNKVFTMHGVIMVFFFLVPSVPATIGNFVIPMMVGAKDLALPKINLLSWYLYVIAGCMVIYTMAAGGVDTGWTFTTPLSTHYLNTHVISTGLAIFVAGFSSIFTGLNFIVTIHKMRCPGMTWFRLPLFVWSNYAASILMVLGTPVLAITLVLVVLERTVAHRRLRSRLWRRPASLPALVLVLLAPRRLHHDSARHGSHLRGRLHLQPQARLRLYGGRLLFGGHRGLRLLRLGAPHVHHGHLQLRGAGLLAAHHAGRGALGHQDLQLGLHALQRLHHL